MRSNFADINILLDRSRSMEKCWPSVISGIAEYIDQQRALPGDVVLSLSLFDDC